MIKFSGRYAALKDFGFRYILLYDNQATYTTYDNGRNSSDVFIRKAGGGRISFAGYNVATSSNILAYLINNNFILPASGLAYNPDTFEINVIPDGEYFGHINRDGNRIRARVGSDTIETLKALWKHGMLNVIE